MQDGRRDSRRDILKNQPLFQVTSAGTCAILQLNHPAAQSRRPPKLTRKERNAMTLQSLKPGQSAQVEAVGGEGALRQHVLDMGLIPGAVRPIADVIPKGLKIPQIGWNGLIFPKDHEKSALYHSTEEGKCVYFVHSYYADTPDEYISAKTEYGALLTASVERENVYGCQFHPEKSGNVGLSILRAFCEIGGCI